MPATIKTKKTAQEIQDAIFQRMSADKKIELGSSLWELARELAPDKIKNYWRDNGLNNTVGWQNGYCTVLEKPRAKALAGSSPAPTA